MSLLRPLLPFLLFLLLVTTPAKAQEINVRTLFGQEFQVGAKYLEVGSLEHSQREVDPAEGKKLVDQGTTWEREVEVLAVEVESRQPNKLRYTYRSMTTSSMGKTTDEPVKGLVVVVDGTQDQPRVLPAGGKELPVMLRRALVSEGQQMSSRKQGQNPHEFLFPRAPVEVGTQWKVDLRAVVEGLGMPTAGFVAAESSATSSLARTNHMLEVHSKIRLRFDSFQGHKLERPMVVDVDLGWSRSPEGPPYGTTETKQLHEVETGGWKFHRTTRVTITRKPLR